LEESYPFQTYFRTVTGSQKWCTGILYIYNNILVLSDIHSIKVSVIFCIYNNILVLSDIHSIEVSVIFCIYNNILILSDIHSIEVSVIFCARCTKCTENWHNSTVVYIQYTRAYFVRKYKIYVQELLIQVKKWAFPAFLTVSINKYYFDIIQHTSITKYFTTFTFVTQLQS
jgi:energy-converting hydrogenase Eha subunit E